VTKNFFGLTLIGTDKRPIGTDYGGRLLEISEKVLREILQQSMTALGCWVTADG
jgi:hypothetical protein